METEIEFGHGRIRIVWTDGPLVCQICGAAFTETQPAMEHAAEHPWWRKEEALVEEEDECPLCEYTRTSTDPMMRVAGHLRRQHRESEQWSLILGKPGETELFRARRGRRPEGG